MSSAYDANENRAVSSVQKVDAASSTQNAAENKLTARDSAIPVMFMRPLSSIVNNNQSINIRIRQQPNNNSTTNKKLFRLTNRPQDYSDFASSAAVSALRASGAALLMLIPLLVNGQR